MGDACILLSCEVWYLLLGQLVATMYIRLMFGVDHTAGQPPKYCAFNIEPRGLPIRMVQGSLYVWDYRIHHWLFYLVLVPLFVLCQWYAALGFAVVMITHGLWYDDRFEFTYSNTRYTASQEDEEETSESLTPQSKFEPVWSEAPMSDDACPEVPLTAQSATI